MPANSVNIFSESLNHQTYFQKNVENSDRVPVGKAIHHQDWLRITQRQTIQQLQDNLLGSDHPPLLDLVRVEKGQPWPP